MRALQRVLLAGAVLVGAAMPADARPALVRGYVRPSTGHYVAPHITTTPNRTRLDNFSTRGNVNPYTGRPGTKPVLPPIRAPH
jgi:hypothetical protein